VDWLIRHEEIEGAVNLAAPEPLANDEFISVLGKACGAHFGMPVAEWMVKAGAFLMRTEPELVLKSRRVVPARLLESGFTFDYPQWPAAARELCARLDAPAEGRVW
jgi:NAD dependent epimerase/dehydratase family enzyme